MKGSIIILLLSFSLMSCKETNKQIVKVEQVEHQEQKKLHWRELPQANMESEASEIMEMRTKENQKKIGKLWDAFERLEKKDFTEDYLTMEEINFTNDLYNQMLIKQGFKFPSEEAFARRIEEVFDVDIYADHSLNPRVKRIGDYLILLTKVYSSEYYKQVPTLDFASEGYIFDMKRRCWTDIGTINGKSEIKVDDFDEEYYVFYNNQASLMYNNFIFYNSKVALMSMYSTIPLYFLKDVGYEGFDVDVIKDVQQTILKEYQEVSAKSRIGYDYRMYDRIFFSRGFNGELKVKKKMLEVAIELAQENEDYISVPLDYYFIQMTTKYIPNEYAADNGEVENYRTILEPYYTPEERAMIWVYTSLLELNVSPKVSSSIPYTFISLAHQFPELYEVAEAHHFFGEDMTAVLEYLE